jgi:cytochrome oxidase Cu insertion factor (SCO1/SenC/PrrC family)
MEDCGHRFAAPTVSVLEKEGRDVLIGRSRRARSSWPATALALAALALCACSSNRSTAAAAPSVGTVAQRTVPAAIGQLMFTDAQGRPVTLASLRGKTVVLTDFLSLCQEVCPLTSANLGQVDQAIGRAGRASEIALVEVTVDPERDTSARLAAYSKIIGAGANWQLLTGSAADVAALWKWFGVAYERQPESSPAPVDWWTGKALTYDVGHSDVLFFLDPQGVERYLISGAPNATSVPIPSALASFLNDEGRTNHNSPAAGAWTAADVDAVLSWMTGRAIKAG